VQGTLPSTGVIARQSGTGGRSGGPALARQPDARDTKGAAVNAVDLPIVATVVLLTLLGLKTGLLKPASGIGGLIIGVVIAIQYSAELAVSLEQQIEGYTVRRIVAFAVIVIITVVVSRIAAFLFKRLLKALVLGWLDHVAGAVAGAALGVVVAGTSVYLLIGADIESTRDALAESKLAPEVTRAALVSSTKPWC
jgi:membrane protein required for colicin V production